jgi:hypothetical protein
VVPELVQLDNQGFPVFLDMPVPFWLEKEAQQAVAMCPALALRLTPSGPSGGSGKSPRPALSSAAPPMLQLVIPPRRELPGA